MNASPNGTHFVAYHNSDERGPFNSPRKNGAFETRKRLLPKRGDFIWCFEGKGSPKQYRLMTVGAVTGSTKQRDGLSLVHYQNSASLQPINVTGLPWFRKLLKDQSHFSFGLNPIRDPASIAELKSIASNAKAVQPRYTDLCAYTIKHSDSFDDFAANGTHTVDTKGKSWATIANLLAERAPSEVVPVLFAPAEYSVNVVACADLLSVKTKKNNGVNSFTFTNFRALSPPYLKSKLKVHDGHPLGSFLKDYAICQTPIDLVERRIEMPNSEESDVAAIVQDSTIQDETTQKALIDARRGQGFFRKQLDLRWDSKCAITECTIREILRASHIKPWKISDNQERLDPENGILLSANIDILFDKGFISFDDGGNMLISKRLSARDQKLLGLPKNLRRKPSSGERSYLAHHRKAFKFKS